VEADEENIEYFMSADFCFMCASMFLFTISVGRFWSDQSVLEFSALKKNLMIISDIERVF